MLKPRLTLLKNGLNLSLKFFKENPLQFKNKVLSLHQSKQGKNNNLVKLDTRLITGSYIVVFENSERSIHKNVVLK